MAESGWSSVPPRMTAPPAPLSTTRSAGAGRRWHHRPASRSTSVARGVACRPPVFRTTSSHRKAPTPPPETGYPAPCTAVSPSPPRGGRGRGGGAVRGSYSYRGLSVEQTDQFSHLVYEVADLARSEQFYGWALGLKPLGRDF